MIKELISKIFGFDKDIEEINEFFLNELEVLEKELGLIQKDYLKLGENNEKLTFKNNELNKKIKELNEDISFLNKQLLGETELEAYLNNKHPKINRTYIRHDTDGDHYIDVRNFIQPYDNNLKTFKGKNYDDIALKCLKWVIDNIKYERDIDLYGFSEYWDFPYQTLKHMKADCEGGSFLLYSMMLASGIPYYRIRLNAGSVNGGGHAYVSYCREYDDEFVVLDWCYWENKKPMKDRPTHKEERNYIDVNRNFYIWFSWNQKYTFGELKLPKELENNFK